jgi:hypothetical protein
MSLWLKGHRKKPRPLASRLVPLACWTQSGRRRARALRPPTPPHIRFRIRRFLMLRPFQTCVAYPALKLARTYIRASTPRSINGAGLGTAVPPANGCLDMLLQLSPGFRPVPSAAAPHISERPSMSTVTRTAKAPVLKHKVRPFTRGRSS